MGALLARHAAAGYGMFGRLWVVMTGPVTILVLADRFTPDAQGYFFTFISLAAARTVAELGLGQVMIVKMAHFFPTSGPHADVAPPRAAGLIRFAAAWFAAAGLVVSAVLCLAGPVLLGTRAGLPVAEWLPPWIALSALVGLDVAVSGLLFPLEGAGHVRQVYLCRMVRSIVNSVALWSCLMLDLQLWSLPIALACSLAWAAKFLLTDGRMVVRALSPGAEVARIDWVADVFPAQWRLALSSLADYVSFYTLTPLFFVMQGAVLAGQLGTTWQLAAAVSAMAGALVATRLPEFSRHAGARSARELDGLLLSTFLGSMAVCLVGVFGVGAGVLVLNAVHSPLATRLLPPGEVAILMLGVLIWHANLPIVAYLRAHGGDPFLPASLSGAVLLFAANVTCGRWFGSAGLLWAYTVTGACFMVPLGIYLLRRKRRACGYPPFQLRPLRAAPMSPSA